MTLFALALAAFVAGAAGALLAARSPRLATGLGAGGAVVGSLLGLVPAALVLSGRDVGSVRLPWSVPGGSLSLAIDPLSAFFLVPLFAVGAATAVYGAAYLLPEARHRSLGPAWLWFDLLLASMALVVAARNGLLFLVAWEAMALSSFFLVVFHHERDGVPRAGWVYLVATHLGTAFLLVLFAWLAGDADSLEFADWRRPASGASWLFALALVGFGAKAGFFPLHVWLPEAHPVAPSHVSALLSAVMVKLGLYGLLRVVSLLGGADPLWGTALLGVGLVSAAYGALALLAQRDLKRLLAYSTVENLGIAAVGLGLGLRAAASGATSLAVVALAGALLHVWNHALFKGLLFLGAGSLARGAGTLDLERLGGVLRRMPTTGASLLVGAAAICALPPLNGFASEFLIYLGSLEALGTGAPIAAHALAVVAGLAFAGAVAAAGFVRAAGVALLGEPRSAEAAAAREVAGPMRGVLAVLAALCLFLGIAAPVALRAAAPAIEQILPAGAEGGPALRAASALLWQVAAAGGAVAAAGAALLWLRARLLPAPVARPVGTWDCGHAAPTPRMQYTASSFAQPLTRLFALVLRVRSSAPEPAGIAPAPASFGTRSEDLAAGVYAGIFAAVAELARRLRPIQAGSPQLYVLYTVLAALALLLWKVL